MADLTPTQHLVLDLLGARRRLGERVWTLASVTTAAVRGLEALGYVEWKHGPTQGTILVWLTDAGLREATGGTYRPPKPDPRVSVGQCLGDPGSVVERRANGDGRESLTSWQEHALGLAGHLAGYFDGQDVSSVRAGVLAMRDERGAALHATSSVYWERQNAEIAAIDGVLRLIDTGDWHSPPRPKPGKVGA